MRFKALYLFFRFAKLSHQLFLQIEDHFIFLAKRFRVRSIFLAFLGDLFRGQNTA